MLCAEMQSPNLFRLGTIWKVQQLMSWNLITSKLPNAQTGFGNCRSGKFAVADQQRVQTHRSRSSILRLFFFIAVSETSPPCVEVPLVDLVSAPQIGAS